MKNKINYLISGRARNGKDTVSTMIEDEYVKLGKKVCYIQLMRPLKELLMDPDYSKSVSLILDGELKAKGKNNLLFVYNEPYYININII